MKKILILSLLIAVMVIGFVSWRVVLKKNLISTPNISPSASSQKGRYTMSEVNTHKDSSSCWSVINGKVYDLTSWINEHPGGADKILGICGSDGSSAFNSQHSGQGEPADVLSSYYLGDLKS